MRFSRLETPEPFAGIRRKQTKSLRTVIGGSDDFYGANSLEHFSSASSLSYTHEDAEGFLDYPSSFAGRAANYWLKDAGVKVWEYEEDYDNWQDSYGMDSVMVFYHSGHGNMDGNGVFQAPLGDKWDNRDWAYSDNMAFGNEELRYLFWSTCFSLRVSGPDNPVRTWWEPNKGGLRMLFGYETTSVDDPNYGKYFWDEWKKGKTFARAFLDASWRISHGQVPVAMAVGANATDAINRLNNERFFSKAPVTKGWYQWQWIGTLPNRAIPRARLALPKGLNALQLDGKLFTDVRMSRLANLVGIARSSAGTIRFDDVGNRMITSRAVQLNVNNEGALNIHFGKLNPANTRLIGESKAISIAKRLIRELDFDKGIELELGNIRHRMTCGGTLKGSGSMDEPAALETIVQFRQCHNGVHSVNSDHGLIAICVDNDGTITNVYNSTKLILGEARKPKSIIPSPPERKKSAKADTEKQFRKAIHGIVNRTTTTNGHAQYRSKTLTEKVGYDFSGKLGLVVRQRDVDVSCGNKLLKRYKVRVRVMG